MHLTNSSRPQPSQDVPVVIVRLGLKRKFLSRMESYDDMRRVVRQKFNIDDNADLTFEVSDFNVCNNERVEVDETAYPAMAPYMDELHLNVIYTEPESSSGTKGKGKARELYPTPTPNVSDEDSVVRDQEESQHAHEISQPPSRVSSCERNLSPPKTQVKHTPASTTYPEDDEEDGDEQPDGPPSLPSPNRTTSIKGKTPSVAPITSPPLPITCSKSKSKSIEPPVANGNHKVDELFNDSVIVDDDIVVTGPHAEPEPQGFVFEPQHFDKKENYKERKEEKWKQQIQRHEVINVDLDERPQYEEAGPSSRLPIITPEPPAQTIKGEEEPKPISKFKSAGTSRLTKPDDDEIQKGSITLKPRYKKSAIISRQNPVKAYDETPPAATQGPVLHEPLEGQENDDENDLIQPDGRFKIYICGPHPDHRAEFMTKARHVLRKVLLGACRTFKLDPKRSCLEQLVVVPEDDGNRELYFQCDISDTVGKAGLRPGSKLRVMVNDDTDEPDEDND
ncbi:hypothetical protein E1B28_007523 [Marasmius oreades]|uniref:Uncharacterized protein n=1 Tax=Marasmius oreades TaxID=181124 RepID=A0A9P7S1W2_9AGAR|nr:uncharacterized protein E1B28_007523 [Marasmius oreades]KAG7093884.1 hypothetical protein E1B28_007523 [Marasmius oreades]